MINLLIWAGALLITYRCYLVAHEIHFSTSGRRALNYAVFSYSYVLLATGALFGAASFTGCIQEAEQFSILCLILASCGMILTDRRVGGEWLNLPWLAKLKEKYHEFRNGSAS